MTKKRFENRLNTNLKKWHILNPVWDNEKEDALNVFEMIDELNRLNLDCSNLIDDNTEYVAEINQMHKENTQLENKLKFLNELNKPYGAIIEENIRLKTFIKRLTNNCGEIVLMNGMGYNVNKILGDLE